MLFRSLGALIFPGDLPRTEALRQSAPQTLPLIGGVVLMLIVAGSIEGYVTPSPNLSPIQKVAVGLGSGALFWGYVALAGREWGRKKRASPSRLPRATPPAPLLAKPRRGE